MRIDIAQFPHVRNVEPFLTFNESLEQNDDDDDRREYCFSQEYLVCRRTNYECRNQKLRSFQHLIVLLSFSLSLGVDAMHRPKRNENVNRHRRNFTPNLMRK